jgi:predicted nucleic acid-binding protein
LLAHAHDCCLTTITLAELRYGIERLRESKKKRDLSRRFDAAIKPMSPPFRPSFIKNWRYLDGRTPLSPQ